MGRAPLPNIVLIVSILFVLLVAMIGFGGKDNVVPLTVPFGMQFIPAGGPELKIWANTPLPAYINVILSNVSKKEEDGSITTGIDIFELFPAGEGTNYGGAKAKFTMRLISPSDVPEFNKTMEMVSMVWRREPSVGGIEQLIYIVATFTLNNWSFMSWAIIIKALASLGIGIFMFVRERNSQNDVVPVVVGSVES